MNIIKSDLILSHNSSYSNDHYENIRLMQLKREITSTEERRESERINRIEKMRERQRLKRIGKNKGKQSRKEKGRMNTRYQNQNEQN